MIVYFPCSEFLVGNREMSLLPVTASILMSFVSALLVLGNTAEMYLHGGQFFLQVIGVSLAYLVTAYIVVPIIYPLKITSLFQVNLKGKILFASGIIEKSCLFSFVKILKFISVPNNEVQCKLLPGCRRLDFNGQSGKRNSVF